MTRLMCSIAVGVALAFFQSTLSVLVMRWAIPRGIFYWAWGGGVLSRFVIFALTAFVVYRYTNLSLAATLISMVLATTAFVVAESVLLIKVRRD